MTNDLEMNILNLVQHVELNKVGWWDDVIQHLILATVWMDGKSNSMSIMALKESVNAHFDLHLDGKIDSTINQLTKSGDLIKLPDGSIKLSGSCVKLIETDVQDAENIINKAKNVFIDNLVHEGLPVEEKEQIWAKFNDIFLRPFIKSIGANIYELLNQNSAMIDQTLLDIFLTTYPIDLRECISNSARSFLNSTDQNVRSYILRSLNTYFCIEACGLDRKTLESLQGSLSKPLEISLFIDTNFLFSILELHDNPSNSAAIGLLGLVKNLNGKLIVKFLVSSQTLQETRSVLKGSIDFLNDTRLTPNMAGAASRFVTGLTKKFFSEVNRGKTPLTPKEYFQPYIDNLVTILRDKGVDAFEEDIEYLNMRQDVIDDILEQAKFEEQNWGDRAKGYKPLEHDVVLWHLIKDRRNINIDSPLDAGYWIVTIDYRFLGFDKYKKSKGVINIPICIHPTTLIQLLQFWLPRSQLLDDALYSSLWLPFIFQDLDPQSENTTIEIVKTLGRFKNIGDLSKDTIVRILLNDALRQKIQTVTDIDEEIELVREALIEQNQLAQAQVDEATNKNIKYEQELMYKDADLARLKEDLKLTREELEQEKISRLNLFDELSTIKSGIDKKERDALAKSTKQKFLYAGIIIPIILCVIIWVLILTINPGIWKFAAALTGIALILWNLLFDYFGRKNAIYSELPFFMKYHSTNKTILSILGAIVLGLITNILFEYLKPMLFNFFHK